MRVDPAEAKTDVYVGLEHLDPETIHLREWGHPSDVTGEKLTFRKGDVIFGRRRAYQRKLAVAEFDGICSAHAMVIRAKPEMILPEFLPFFLQSDMFMERAIEISVGSLSPTINWKTLRVQEFPLPPIEVQKRIAEILWTADEALERYKETANDLKRLLEATSIAVVEEAWKLSDTAPLERLLDRDRPLCYGIVQPGPPTDDGHPFIRVLDLEHEVIVPEQLKRVSTKVNDQYKRSIVREDDILVSVVGTIGRSIKVPRECDGFNIARAIARLSPSNDLDPDYLLTLLRSPSYQQRLVGDSFETARKTLNLKSLRELKIPTPVRADQRRLVAPVLAIERQIEENESHIWRLKSLLKSLSSGLTTDDSHV